MEITILFIRYFLVSVRATPSLILFFAPFTRQQLLNPVNWMIGDFVKDGFEPGHRVDLLFFAGSKKGIHHGDPLGGIMGTGKCQCPYKRFLSSIKFLYFSILQHFYLRSQLFRKGLLPLRLVRFMNLMAKNHLIELSTYISTFFSNNVMIIFSIIPNYNVSLNTF